jgi:hypothetical protein
MSHQPVPIGGPDAWRAWVTRAGILVSLQWIELEAMPGEPPQLEPCMALMKATKAGGRGCWVIPLGDAWRYRHPKECAVRALDCAMHIGLGGTKHDVIAVIDAIHNHMDDFVKMPPAPPLVRDAAAQNVGEAKLYANGQLMRELDVRSDGVVVH